MRIQIDNKFYEVVINYKNNKNMYMRVKDDLKIYITAPKYYKDKVITEFINKNINFIEKQIKIIEEKKDRQKDKFLFLGDSYDINYIEGKKIYFIKDQVYIGRLSNVDNFYRKQAQELFNERLIYCYNLFTENIPYPTIKIRKMTSKWGVCNTTKKEITLNLDLVKIDIKYLDYVIVHELSHLIYPNHSKYFWEVVSKYIKEYKIYRKEMNYIL